MKLTFHGAAGEVTGSQHLVETDSLRLLLDCGFFQGRRSEARARNERFPFDPRTLDAVVLSHAHIDHSGNLPGLYKAGFRGPVFLTPATADVARIMLGDSAKIQAEDARYLAGRFKGGHPPITPLYEQQHVDGIVGQFEPLAFDDWHDLGSDLRLRFSDSGHILGSAITELELDDGGIIRRVIFTGDLGRRGLPLLRDPQPVPGGDVLITESTYGNRVHPSVDDIRTELKRIVHEAYVLEGRVIIPAFSLGRTQQVVYFLNDLFNSGELARVPIYVDSPLARRLTGVFRDHVDLLDEQVQELLQTDRDPFGFPGLEYVGRHAESMALNHRPGPLVIISASGMCESGRVVHHLKHALDSVDNTIVLIGFQGQHTLGRRLQEGHKLVRLFGQECERRAKIETLSGLSGHADVEDFKWFFEQMSRRENIGQAFLVHGEEDSSRALASLLVDFCDHDPVVPRRGETYEV